MMDAITLTRINEGSRWGIARAGAGLGSGSILFGPGIYDPLCGWAWLLGRAHPYEECQISISAWGCRFTATVNPDAHKGKIVQEISRVALARPRR